MCNSSFATLLRAFRELRGLSQNGLARAVGVSPSTINMLESSGRRPSRELVLKLALELGLSGAETDELLIASGLLPTSIDHISPADTDLLMVARILADESIPVADRLRYRQLLRLLTQGWRSTSLESGASQASSAGVTDAKS
jgi:transcriptional regulator with XRE-family HTH domain